MWGMAFFGVLFSIYLTFLEPFVIGATCMWCISSAILITLIFIAATGPAKRAWQEDDFDDEDLDDDEFIIPDAEGEEVEDLSEAASEVEDRETDQGEEDILNTKTANIEEEKEVEEETASEEDEPQD
jgi:hypothetical protein